MPDKSVFLKKFHSNTIKFVLEGQVAEARDEMKRGELIEKLCEAMQCTPKGLSWLLNNTRQPTVPQLVAAAQVLGVSVDDLIKLEDAPATEVSA